MSASRHWTSYLAFFFGWAAAFMAFIVFMASFMACIFCGWAAAFVAFFTLAFMAFMVFMALDPTAFSARRGYFGRGPAGLAAFIAFITLGLWFPFWAAAFMAFIDFIAFMGAMFSDEGRRA